MKCKDCGKPTGSWRRPYCRKHWASFRTEQQREEALAEAWGLTEDPDTR